MKKIFYRSFDTPFSLHDLRVSQILYENNDLHIQFEYMIDYSQEEERYYEASICFENAEPDFCQAYILDNQKNQTFTGCLYSLEDFLKQFPQFDFTIIYEYYGYEKCLWQGELSIENKIFSCQLEIVYTGDIIYKIGKEKR
ncbi:hypothetical protein ACVRXQ_01585 [Streptococcus panodentis]|uniref:Uncharacterized protein n=1 Tax=Streptococcus panodentis TaxID=1581472 RepID=A0ABS5AY01_9STRE|nr:MULTISPECIES: hypothetical protein [Streptococcus]MBP2621464.1 hypothetical protein [Streptococcus panodentis]